MPTTADTSLAARDSIRGHAATMRKSVLDAITAAGVDGLTDDEGAKLLEMNPSTYRPRRGELDELGLIVQSGEVRATASGRRAVVWVVKS